MENPYISEEIISSELPKLEWNTPEVKIFSVKETTLAGEFGSTDRDILS